MKVNNKKQLVLTLIAVVTLLVLVGGATYAYFSTLVTNNFGTQSIGVEAGSTGSVTLNGSSTSFSMQLTPYDMDASNYGDYYVGPSGKVKDTPTEVTLGTAESAVGDSNIYHCTYTLQVSQSYSGTKNLYEVFSGNDSVTVNGTPTYYTASSNELVLYINGVAYDLSNTYNHNLHSNANFEVQGAFDILEGQTSVITAGLKFSNIQTKDQSLLADSGVNISINVKSGTLSCNVTNTWSGWQYYGWQDNNNNPIISPTFDGARGNHLLALRTTYDINGYYQDYGTLPSIPLNDEPVQVCALIDTDMVCLDSQDPTRGDVIPDGTYGNANGYTNGVNIDCSIDTINETATCNKNDSPYENCNVNSHFSPYVSFNCS